MLFVASILQAAHYHKLESSGGDQTHALCALCIHADRWIDPPRFVPLAIAFTSWLLTIPFFQAPSYSGAIVRRYNSRAPPLI